MYDLLAGVRVVEGASFIAGPSCGLHMAQMGAQVIRIDPPDGGPDYRRWPLANGDGSSLYWEGLNKGKKSIVIDTACVEGRELALAIATAPGDMAGLVLTNLPETSFLSHAALVRLRPDIISLRVMGWPDGSPAVDYTVNAAAGVPMMTGPQDDPRPVNHLLPAWDLLGGAYAAFALLAALLRRTATGVGGEIRLPLSDLAATSLGHIGSLAEVLTTGADRPRTGNDLFGAFGRDFVCADGQRVMVVAITPRQWAGLVRALRLEEAVGSLEKAVGLSFATDEGARFRHRDRLFPLFEQAILQRTSADLGAAFRAAAVTFGPYQSLHAAATTDKQLFVENPQFQKIRHPSGLTYPAAGPPATLGAELRAELRPAPVLGQHTNEILSDVLGLPGGAIADLHDRKIVQ